MKRILASLLLASIAIPVLAQKNSHDKPDLSKAFENARYVYVEAHNGDSSSQDTYPGDREAIYNLKQQLHDWGRYSTNTSRDQADLIFVVHKARSNSNMPIDVGPGIPTPQRPSSRNPSPRDPSADGNGRGADTDAEVGSPDDQLSVYLIGPSGSLTGPIWQQTLRNGLNMPKMQLFKRLKQEIEEAYPK